MDAGKLWFLNDFIGKNNTIFKIPVYQRNYDWSENNCNRLLDDVVRILDSGKKHFIGSILFMSSRERSFAGGAEYNIIDGQQRITTVMLLLKALADISYSTGGRCHIEIQATLLQNQFGEEKYKIKLKPIKSDNEQFVALINNKIDELNPEGHISKNYNICKKRIEKMIRDGYSTDDIYTAVKNFEIVYVELKDGEDDPQVIFESINSTGLDLSNADLIRNFLLMNTSNAESLFESYWLEIEKMLKPRTDYANLNLFYMHYITYKTNTPMKSERIYEHFVELYEKGNYTKESILAELKYFATIFQSFVYENNRYPHKVCKILKSLRQLKQTTSYPFLLHIFNDFEQKVIDEQTLEKLLKLLLSYLVKRAVCGVPTNSLRGFFTYFYNRVFKVKENKKMYYEAINKYLHIITTKDAMPSDSEFKQSLLTTSIYKNNTLCKYLLMDIENGDSKETLNVDNLTIEHIMPQRLGVEWRHILPEEHDQYLHVLGNLSVTGYNSELSNKSFAEKKKIIVENSKAVILNKDISECDCWDIGKIIKRGKRLRDLVFQRYYISPEINNKIEFEYLTEMTLTDYDKVTGSRLVKFSFDGSTYYQDTFIGMLQDIIELLDKRHPNILENLAQENYAPDSAMQNHPYLSTKIDNIKRPIKIKDNVFLETNFSATLIIRFINRLFEEYQEPIPLLFYVIASNEEGNIDTEITI